MEDRDDLERAAALVSWLNRPPVEKVLVTLPWLDSKEQVRSANALRDLFNECGCLWGGLTFLVTLTGAFSFQFIQGGLSLTRVAVLVLIAVCSAFTAKLLSLAWSRWRLLAWLQRMRPPPRGVRVRR